MTIVEAIKKVMLAKGEPMTANEAYAAIVTQNLYEFHADDPVSIVRAQVRRHCEGLDFTTASATKHFRLVADGRFEPLPEVVRAPQAARRLRVVPQAKPGRPDSTATLPQLLTLHEKYVVELKRRILRDLKTLSPKAFEEFAKRLLDVYGFHGTAVTQISGDGGIDGYGKLKVGLANLNVAFQCKRWAKGNIQRPEIDKFRGAAQGDYEQGLFFTTASFSEGAIGASIKRGAVPIILVDGPAIVDLMIDKGFGVQLETLSIPSYALDLALSSEASTERSPRMPPKNTPLEPKSLKRQRTA
jgi:restriction system protein